MVVGVSLSAVGESVDGSHLSLPPYYAVNHTEAVGITLLTPGESGDGSLIPPVYVSRSGTFLLMGLELLPEEVVTNSPLSHQ